MSDIEQLESLLIKLGCPYETLADRTWVIRPDAARGAPIAIKLASPIVLFSVNVLELDDALQDREGLFRRLLELNSELLHSSYALQGERVVLAGAQQIETLDFTDFQAMIDDMCMALDNHFDKLASWIPTARDLADHPENHPASEGSA